MQKPEQTSKEFAAIRRQSAMLRSTLQSYPKAKLNREPGAFGVSLDDHRYLFIVYDGHWTVEDMRQFVVFFARWLAVDPAYIVGGNTVLAGQLFEEIERPFSRPG